MIINMPALCARASGSGWCIPADLSARRRSSDLFAAVIHRVADEVAERRFEFLEDVAVHLRVFADDFKTDFFPERAGKVANHARNASHAFAKRPHAALQNFTIQPVRKICRTAVVHFQIHEAVGQKLAALADFFDGLMHLIVHALGTSHVSRESTK